MNKKIRAWIVDDDSLYSQTLADVVGMNRKVGEVRCFMSAEDALSTLHASRKPPDIIFLDINLPGMNGLEAIEPIKDIHPDTQILLMSGTQSREDAQMGFHRGAVGFLSKVSTIDDIEGAILNAVKLIGGAQRQRTS
ncbi:MAG: response regulator [Bacteroidota bacterium]